MPRKYEHAYDWLISGRLLPNGFQTQPRMMLRPSLVAYSKMPSTTRSTTSTTPASTAHSVSFATDTPVTLHPRRMLILAFLAGMMTGILSTQLVTQIQQRWLPRPIRL